MEDEDDMREALCCGLRKRGYAVDSSGDGAEAVQLCYINRYDLVVLDLNLPGMDGMEVLRHIQSLENHTKVLILSARSELTDKIAGLDSGASDYLTKPFHFQELEARIRMLLRRSFTQADAALMWGGLCLDTNARTASCNGIPLELTMREFAILEYMIRNQGIVLSKEKIEQHIWNYDYEGGSSVIKVYIRYLRKKIDDDFDVKLIHTVRNAGYVLRVEP